MIRAYVREDQHGFGVSVIIAMEAPFASRRVLRFNGDSFAWDEVIPLAQARPTFRLHDDEMARALLDALADHYHHGGDSRALRKDYAAICERLDNLTDAVHRLVSSP